MEFPVDQSQYAPTGQICRSGRDVQGGRSWSPVKLSKQPESNSGRTFVELRSGVRRTSVECSQNPSRAFAELRLDPPILQPLCNHKFLQTIPAPATGHGLYWRDCGSSDGHRDTTIAPVGQRYISYSPQFMYFSTELNRRSRRTLRRIRKGRVSDRHYRPNIFRSCRSQSRITTTSKNC